MSSKLNISLFGYVQPTMLYVQCRIKNKIQKIKIALQYLVFQQLEAEGQVALLDLIYISP